MQPVLLPSAPLLLARKAAVVPVRVDDPFERWSVADVTVVRGDAIEHYNDHIWMNRSVVPVHNRLVGFHHLGMSGPLAAWSVEEREPFDGCLLSGGKAERIRAVLMSLIDPTHT
jgi:hypothetical protein